MRFSSIVATILLASVPVVGCGTSGPVHEAPERLPSTLAIAPITYDALFVVNGGDNSISVIDTEQQRVVDTIRIENASYPHHVYLNRDGSKMLVAVPGMDLSGGHVGHHSTSSPPGAVLVLDTKTGATLVSRRLPVMNHNAIFSPGDESEVWTAQFDGYVLVLDATTLELKSRIPVGAGPAEVTFSLDGRYAYVANSEGQSVSIIDPDTKRVERVIPVGKTPVGAWQAPNGMAYVDNETDGTLSAINTLDLRVEKTFDLKFTPGMVGFGPDKNVWVADSYNAKVAIRSPENTDQVVAIAPAGRGAHGIVFNGNGKTAYISNQDANTVTVLDIATRTPIATIPVGAKPNGMVWRKK